MTGKPTINNSSSTEAWVVRAEVPEGKGYHGDGQFAPALSRADLYSTRADAEAAGRAWRAAGHPSTIIPGSFETVRVLIDEGTAQPIP